MKISTATVSSDLFDQINYFSSSIEKPDDIVIRRLLNEAKKLRSISLEQYYTVTAGIYSISDRIDEAIELHKKALLYSEDSSTLINFFITLSSTGNASKCIDFVDDGMVTYRDDIDYVRSACEMLFKSGELVKFFSTCEHLECLYTSERFEREAHDIFVIKSAAEMIRDQGEIESFKSASNEMGKTMQKFKVHSRVYNTMHHEGEFLFFVGVNTTGEQTAELNEYYCGRLAELENFSSNSFMIAFKPTTI
jgi:hypothetical protein